MRSSISSKNCWLNFPNFSFHILDNPSRPYNPSNLFLILCFHAARRPNGFRNESEHGAEFSVPRDNFPSLHIHDSDSSRPIDSCTISHTLLRSCSTINSEEMCVHHVDVLLFCVRDVCNCTTQPQYTYTSHIVQFICIAG